MDGESDLHSQPIAVEIAAEAAQFRRTSPLRIGDKVDVVGMPTEEDCEHESARRDGSLRVRLTGARKYCRGSRRSTQPDGAVRPHFQVEWHVAAARPASRL